MLFYLYMESKKQNKQIKADSSNWWLPDRVGAKGMNEISKGD